MGFENPFSDIPYIDALGIERERRRVNEFGAAPPQSNASATREEPGKDSTLGWIKHNFAPTTPPLVDETKFRTSLGKVIDPNTEEGKAAMKLFEGYVHMQNEFSAPYRHKFGIVDALAGAGSAGMLAWAGDPNPQRYSSQMIDRAYAGNERDLGSVNNLLGQVLTVGQSQMQAKAAREQAMLNSINRDRTQRGLPPFPSYAHVQAAAQGGDVAPMPSTHPQPLHPAGNLPPPTGATRGLPNVPGVEVAPAAPVAGAPQAAPSAKSALPTGPQRSRVEMGGGYAPLSPEEQAQMWAAEANDTTAPASRRMAARQAYQLYRSEENNIQSRLAIGGAAGGSTGSKDGDAKAETLDSIGKAQQAYNKVLEASPEFAAEKEMATKSVAGRVDDSRKRFEELHKQAEESGEFLQNAQLFEDALKGAIEKGQITGPTADWRLKMSGVMKELGFTGEDLSNLESMKKSGIQAAASLAKTISARGATQMEFQTFQNAVPGLSLSPTGNLKLIAAMKAMANAKISMRDEAVRYQDEQEAAGKPPLLDRHFEARLTGVQRQAIDDARAAMADAVEYAKQSGVLKGDKGEKGGRAAANDAPQALPDAAKADLQKQYAKLPETDRAAFAEKLRARGIDPAEALGDLAPKAKPVVPPRGPDPTAAFRYDAKPEDLTTDTQRYIHKMRRFIGDSLGGDRLE